MNCFKQDELVAQYHPYHYENGATISFGSLRSFCLKMAYIPILCIMIRFINMILTIPKEV